jgi:hypothetical protein
MRKPSRAREAGSIINALIAAETMTGINNRKVLALPHERLREVMKKYGRLAAGMK